MPIISKVPHEVEQVFGPVATDKFVDFLNSSFLLQKEDTVTVVSDRFEKALMQHSTGLRLEMAEVRGEMAEIRADMAELRSDMQTQMAELRSDMETQIAGLRSDFAELRADTREQIAELRAETNARIDGVRLEIADLRTDVKADIAGVQKEITGIHKEIATQTRWMLTLAVAAMTLYPILSRLVVRLIP